ncbi:hypothetical protein K3757_12775 [Sulfitobacter sp. S223]|uniref:hypothetical protein n=1 Tax=Sulfitobacter sp. S223 TaxID=2867023 RepID=UPI0021A3388D|nr:hypothetical protein [Sulfitobacter sp. S223]UWR25338.1 hypothetical protein K3757_12775 [Sulfitobacter sp. S223]
MRLKLPALICLLGLSALPVQAQEQMKPDAFLDLVQGRTLTFTSMINGGEVGVEQFLRRDLSVWADRSGRCTYGRIEIRGPLLCFVYEDAPDPNNCWIPFNDEGTLLVLSQSSREVQRISDISQEPVICEGAPSS